jgi:membrane-bound lytic murein transglycosylase D
MKNNNNTVLHRPSILVVAVLPLFLAACMTTSKQDVGAIDDSNDTDSILSTPAMAETSPENIINRPHLTSYTPDTAMPWLSLATPMETKQPELGDSGPSIYPLDEQESSSPGNNNSVSAADTTTEMPNDLWQRIRDGFRLEGQDHRFVKPYIDWYAKHQAYLDRVVERARPFLYDIVEELKAQDMPMEIALLPVVESAFQPFAYSPGRAAGIWQFIPGTGKIYGLKQNWWYDGRRDVPAATKAALKYLSRLHKRFDGDWLLALASYNSGEGRVSRAVKKNKRKGRPIDFWSLDLPVETKGYVPKLLAISAIVARTKEHNIVLGSIPDEPYLKRIDIGSQIDLALAAELADLPIETIYKLNPAFNRWATDPKGPHRLSLPIDKAEGFLEALAKVNKKSRIRWQRHRIRQGETLGHIARKFQTTVELLQDVNNIRDKWIRAGKSIIIPVATKNLKHYLSEDQRRLALQRTNRRGIKVKHTVRPGDTFWDISRKYKVKVGQLASWNGMSPRDSLKPGQKLVIWAKNRSIASARYAAPPSNARRQQLHYKVRKGDSLARIAQKFSVSISKIRRWNSLPKGKYLQPGKRLTLYVDVTRQS